MLTRAVVDANTVALNKELQQRHLDANRKVFFCGSWSCDGLPILESAVTSAMKIAEIFGAPLPFQGLKPVVEVAPATGLLIHAMASGTASASSPARQVCN